MGRVRSQCSYLDSDWGFTVGKCKAYGFGMEPVFTELYYWWAVYRHEEFCK